MDDSHLSKRHFVQVFQLFLGAFPVIKDHKFKPKDEVPDVSSDAELNKLLKLFVQRCQQNLLGLNKFLSGSSKKGASGKSTEKSDWAKDMYSKALQITTTDSSPVMLHGLMDFLQDLSKEISKLK